MDSIRTDAIVPGPSSRSPVLAIQHCIAHEEISAQLRKFWEIEEVPQQHHSSIDEARCDKHFTETHTHSQGRYIVWFPFKTSPPLDLGASRSTSLAAYKRSEFRLKAHPKRKAAEYHDFLQEYEQLGHMRKVSPPDESTQQTLYIPHHAVIRTHSTTTRLRVVFNASAPTSNGTSLNDHLLIGPKLQLELPSILTRWRQFRYVYIADIAIMYRQIRIDERDQLSAHIMRPSVDSPIEDYCLLTVTYGTASAPYLALRVLKQLSTDEGADFPLAVPVLHQHLYVDDCVFGADDIPLAQQTRDQLTVLLGRAGFRLCKWASNHPVLLTGIDPQDHGLAQSKPLQADDSLKVLGITWNPALDVFQVEITISSAIPATKRAVLSTIATVFDPIGWFKPVIITAKIFLQKLWAARCDWDENLPDKLSPLWQLYYKSLPLLREISIPRWTGDGLDSISAELHGFADASTVAYGAVTYLKLTKFDGSVQIPLLFAKSKVAPLKPVSVPRLELCATVLLSRIIAFLRPLLNHINITCYCWTDSTVALAWLSQHPSRWKTFVANRVHEECTNFWLKTIQRTLFHREYYSLVHNHSISKHSKLIALNPYVDKDDLIRIGGRLRNSALSHQSKNPIILASHPLVTSLIRDVHLKALHAGPQLTLSRLREEFWLLRACQTIRSVLHQCIVCTREKAAVANELMSDLPDFRVRPVPRAFYHIGIDYAGPIQIRSTPGRGHKSHKAYISVFVCMTVKATHLELVNELSTQAFPAAFARFCARRGVPNTVYSDNATNFQGAQRELTATWHAATSDSFLNNIAEQGVNWKFIPPSSPHFGGLWEACVRSVKYHLKRVIGVHTLTYEEMSTLLCKIETCLNSRPLSQMSDHIDDYTTLTPSHFLVGSTRTSVSEPSLLCEKEARLTC